MLIHCTFELSLVDQRQRFTLKTNYHINCHPSVETAYQQHNMVLVWKKVVVITWLY